MFNQAPQKIVQTNRLPFLIGIIVLMVVMGVFMYKTQMNQKVQIVQSKPRQSIDISQKTESSSWFNDEKFRNILRGLNKTFYHQTVTTKQIEDISSFAPLHEGACFAHENLYSRLFQS